jgi:hypothetical protein
MVVFHKGQNQAGWFSEVCLIYFFLVMCFHVFMDVHVSFFHSAKLSSAKDLLNQDNNLAAHTFIFLRRPEHLVFFKKLNKCYTCIQMPYRLPYECHTLPYIHVFTFFLNIVELECHTQCHTMRMPYRENAIPYAIRTWTECHTYGILRYGILMVWHCVWHSGVWGVSKPEYMYGIEGSGSTYLDFRFYLMRQTFTELKRTILDRTCPIKTECRQDFSFSIWGM